MKSSLPYSCVPVEVFTATHPVGLGRGRKSRTISFSVGNREIWNQNLMRSLLLPYGNGFNVKKIIEKNRKSFGEQSMFEATALDFSHNPQMPSAGPVSVGALELQSGSEGKATAEERPVPTIFHSCGKHWRQ